MFRLLLPLLQKSAISVLSFYAPRMHADARTEAVSRILQEVSLGLPLVECNPGSRFRHWFTNLRSHGRVNRDALVRII